MKTAAELFLELFPNADVTDRDGDYHTINFDEFEKVMGKYQVTLEKLVMPKIVEIKNKFYKEFTLKYEEPINYETMDIGKQIELSKAGWRPNPKKLQQTVVYIKMKELSPTTLWEFIEKELINFSTEDKQVMPKIEGITRFVVIDHRTKTESFGRFLDEWNIKLSYDIQDNGKTLKIFMND